MKEIVRLKNFGIKVKASRLRKNLSQEELAELVNISRNMVSLIETGKVNPTILTVVNLAKALEVDINSFTDDI